MFEPQPEPVVDRSTDITVVLLAAPGAPAIDTVVRSTSDALDTLGLAWDLTVVAQPGRHEPTGTAVEPRTIAAAGDVGLDEVRWVESSGDRCERLVAGLRTATGERVALIDAAAQIEAAAIEPLVRLCDLGWDAALGRTGDIAEGDVRAEPPLRDRRALAAARLVVDPDLAEAWCGMSLWRAEVIDAVLPHLAGDGSAVDVALVAWASVLGYRRLAVHPVVSTVADASIAPPVTVDVVRDLLGLRRRLQADARYVRREHPPRLRDEPARWAAARRRRQVRELVMAAHRAAELGTEAPIAALDLVARAGGDVEVLRHARHYAQAIGGRRRNDGLIAALRLLDDALAEAGDRAGAAVGAPLAH